MDSCCGLVIHPSKEPVPLKSISTSVEVKGFVVDVVSTLVYQNVEENPVEAVFVFPMDDDSAVYKFEATVDGKTIVAEIQEQKQARDTYDDAISSGQEAFLLEQDESSADVFTCTVGNLPSKQEAAVSLAFVRELPLEADGAVRFVLPAILNPRYTPQGAEQGRVTQQIPRVPKGEVPYKLELKANIQYPHGITSVQSNCSLIPLQYLTPDKTSAQISLEEGYKFDKDVELLICYSDVHKPSISLESGCETTETGTLMGDPVLMLNFYPSFPENMLQSNSGEFIFLVDRSGSMDCPMNNKPNAPQRIDSAKETLLFLMKSLPLGCYFNIYGFGSHYESFFPESREYTQESMQEALEKVKTMAADFGGTEILDPLQDIYKKACQPGHPRQLFVFTDGEVGNTAQVIALVQRNASNHRCFSFGIGEGASTALIKGIAKAASGTAEFITGSERMQPKVLQSLKRALQSAVKDLSVNWQLPSGLEVSLLSKAPVVMFKDQRSIIYAQLKGKLDTEAEGHASVEYTFEDQVIKKSLQFSLQPDRNPRFTVHHLAAKRVIAELEGDENGISDEVKKKVIDISLQAGVISSHTAFVAVNKELNQSIQGPLIRRNMPMEGRVYGMGMRMACAPMPMACMFSASRQMMYQCSAAMGMAPMRMVCNAPVSQSSFSDCDFALGDPESAASMAWEEDEAQEKFSEGSPVVELISLQNADGSWKLDKAFAAVMKFSEQEISNQIPKKDIDSGLWVTVLAIVWLHAFGAELKEEWELLVGKALTWVKGCAGPNLKECAIAASDLLKTSFDPQIFGL